MQYTFLASDEMNSIKYAAYRTAMKLRALQKVTHRKSCTRTKRQVVRGLDY